MRSMAMIRLQGGCEPRKLASPKSAWTTPIATPEMGYRRKEDIGQTSPFPPSFVIGTTRVLSHLRLVHDSGDGPTKAFAEKLSRQYNSLHRSHFCR